MTSGCSSASGGFLWGEDPGTKADVFLYLDISVFVIYTYRIKNVNTLKNNWRKDMNDYSGLQRPEAYL